MLETLFVDNFKALHNLELKNLKKLNVFIGQNSSGKSSILQSIAFLAQSVDHAITYEGIMADLGSFERTVFGHRRRRQIRIELAYSIAPKEGFFLRIKRGKKPIILRGSTKVHIAVEIGKSGITRQELKCPELGIECDFHTVITDQRFTEERLVLNGKPAKRQGNAISHLLMWNVDKILPKKREKQRKAAMQQQIDITNELLRIVRDRLNATFYFSTTRAIKEWSQDLRETNSFGALGQDTISMLHQIYSNDPYTFQRIAKWIDKMGVGTLFSTVKGARSSILLGDPVLEVKSNLVNSGFGINQLISVIGQCFASPQGSVIMIEEPEISLHPGAIGVLADMFLETISNEKQILLSSHSDRLILELWARVKLGLVDRKDVALYLVEKTSKGVTAREIELDQRIEEIKREISSLYEPKSPLEDLLSVAEKSGDKDLSKKDLSDL